MKAKSLHRLSLWFSALLLMTGCSGGETQPSLSSRSDVAIGAPQAGPTSFISFLPLQGQSLDSVTRYRYSIAPKAGAVSSAVQVAYSEQALISRGYATKGSSTTTVPVFGLYAGRSNHVDLQLDFADGSSQALSTDIVTPAYADPNGIFDKPNILQARAPDKTLEFSFFLMKSRVGGTVVVDTDGEVRWVPVSPFDALSTTFSENAFIVGSVSSALVQRLEFDGRSSSFTLLDPSYIHFHHNIDRGKFGLLGEVDVAENGGTNVESVLAEFSPSGVVLKEWDFASILSQYMLSQGDDPSNFVRPGVDWFHMNAATYDARDDSIIASSRENFVIKVDYKTGQPIWILGDPTKYWYSFPSLRAKALLLESGGLYPIGQHATSITSNGLLMLFNDGAASFNQPAGTPSGESRTYSAVSAYAIDLSHMTAREVWNFDYGQTIFSDICSSTYEAANGSLLVDYATASNRTKARLVGLDAYRSVVFDFEYSSPSPCATSWNAEPIPFESMIYE